MPLDPTVVSWLAAGAAVGAALALIVASVAWRRAGRSSRWPKPQLTRPARRARSASRPAGVGAGEDYLRAELEGLRAEVGDALRHLAVVRYDAFGDMGGQLSWSLALLDDAGDGIVLTSIHGRSDSRTYAKNIREWISAQPLSPEENEAIGLARGDAIR